MNLTQRARAQGIHPQTAYRWLREGIPPVPVVRVNSRSILVAPEAVRSGNSPGNVGWYAGTSLHDQRADLDRQMARLLGWATEAGLPVVRVEAEVGSGMNGARAKVRRLRVRDMMEVLTSFGARQYGRRSARNRALKVLGCALRDIGPRAVEHGRS